MQFPELNELDSIPTFNEFVVTLREFDEGGQHVIFTTGDGTELASFPGWDHADRDLRHFVPSDVPLGSWDDPFDESDDGWRINIFEYRGFIYVLEGDDPNTEDFGTFFRVPRDQYLQAWAFLIDAFNPIMPLDES